VRFSAYVLNANTAVARALEGAAVRGARVDVELDGAPLRERSGVLRANAAAAAALTAAGARVRETNAGEPALHLKAALVDGVAYLDDRNWASGDRDTIVALDDPAAVAAIASALDGRPVGSGALATEKRAALDLEATAIYDAPGDRVDVETESFGATVVSKALAARAAHGAHVRLLVSDAELRGPAGGRERRALAKLAAAGVVIEATANTEKLCVAGDEVWIGSANATFSPEPSLDSGLRSRDPALVAGVSRAFERNWLAGRALSTV
jgi:phosphatidylserine/phosphatidylglycerophosphate/cardiolipin synthase-like enzyme